MWKAPAPGGCSTCWWAPCTSSATSTSGMALPETGWSRSIWQVVMTVSFSPHFYCVYRACVCVCACARIYLRRNSLVLGKIQKGILVSNRDVDSGNSNLTPSCSHTVTVARILGTLMMFSATLYASPSDKYNHNSTLLYTQYPCESAQLLSYSHHPRQFEKPEGDVMDCL